MGLITKKHKLYFVTDGGQFRRLDKAAPQLFIYILKAFSEGGREKEYQEKNKDVKKWNEYQPIRMSLPEDHQTSFKILQQAIGGHPRLKNITISYNGTWRPLVVLSV